MRASGNESADAGAAAADVDIDEKEISAGGLIETALWTREGPPGCVTRAAGTRRAGPMMVNLRRMQSAAARYKLVIVSAFKTITLAAHGRDLTCWQRAAHHQTA
jgi:hypothetical protein